MTRYILWVCFLACISVSGLDAQSATLKGQVVDTASNISLQEVVITLEPGQFTTYTDQMGNFSFPKIHPGAYRLNVNILGYEDYTIQVELNEKQEVFIPISLTSGIIELASVHVTATPQWQAKAISDVDIMLRSVNTSQDILEMVPGLFIAQHGGGGKAEQIFLRGFDIDHGTDISITADGIPVNMVSHAHGQGYADLHFLIPETVDRVHFGKGPYHTHHGNMSTAGFVGFKTKNKLEESMISLQAGQFNTYRALGMIKLLHGGPDAKSDAYLAGEFFSTDGYFNSDQDFGRYSLFGKYNLTLGDRHYLTFSASSFASTWNASGQIPLRAVESNLIDYFGAIDDTEGGTTRRTNANLQIISSLENGNWIKNQVYYSKYDFDLFSNFTFFLHNPEKGDQIRQRENRDLLGYKGSYHLKHQAGIVALATEMGIQFRHDMSRNNELSRTADRTELLERLSLGNIHESNATVYLQETMTFSDALSVVAGIRYDHFLFSYQDKLYTGQQKFSDNVVSPKINAYLKLSDKVQLSGHLGYGFHSNDTRVVVVQRGNETLPKALGMDLGVVWKAAPRVLLSSSLWWLHLDQEFVYVGDEAVVEPGGRTRRMGMEVSGRCQISDWLYADADINYTIARAVDEPEGLHYLPLAPRFSAIAGLTLTSGKYWSGSLRGRILGDRPANESNELIATGYTLLDAKVNYRVNKIEVGLNVENLLNVKWREAQFETESRLQHESIAVSEIHFTPGAPFTIKCHMAYHF